jgi:hypothetical protein
MTHTQENDMSENKSGFEIRADLLNLAQGLLESNAQRVVDAHYFSIEQGGVGGKDSPLPIVEVTSEQIIETAKQFNEFVTEK